MARQAGVKPFPFLTYPFLNCALPIEGQQSELNSAT